MKGRILTYSPQDSAGVITADDNARYPFAGSEWKDPSAPAPYTGAYVDFIIQDGDVSEIYLALDAPPATAPRKPKKKVVAGILALIFGGLGIHKFYLGHTTEGIIHLLIFYIGLLPLFPVFIVLIVQGEIFPQAMLIFIVITLPLFIGTLAISIIAIIEGIIYLIKSDENFNQTYVIGQKKWF